MVEASRPSLRDLLRFLEAGREEDAPALRAPVVEAPPEVPAMDEGASPATIDDVQLGESSP